MSRPSRTPLERFLTYFEVHETGCWVWQKSLSNGYGGIHLDDGRTRVSAHRFSYEHFVGPVPEGLHLDHLCRNRACVNPDHLEPVTIRENLMRGPGTKAAVNARKTHCVNGHEFTPQNTATTYRGNRRCRRCEADRVAAKRKATAPEREAARLREKQNRYCPICGEQVPLHLISLAVYCSARCRVAARPPRRRAS